MIPKSIGLPLFAGGFYDLIFEDVFFAPLSTSATDPFKVEMTDPNTGEILVADNDNMILSGLETGAL